MYNNRQQQREIRVHEAMEEVCVLFFIFFFGKQIAEECRKQQLQQQQLNDGGENGQSW